MMTTVLSSPLRAAIIGCGQIAGGYDLHGPTDLIRTHVRAYQESKDVKLVAVMDSSADRANDFARQWGILKAYVSLAELLDSEQPDLVSICTPDTQHAEDIRTCLSHPTVKAIWCEKPLALDVDVARKLIARADEKKVVLAVNYQRQWETSHQRLAQELQDGLWGRVLGGTAVYSKGIFHNGSHLITLLRGLLGEPQQMKVHRAFYDYSSSDPTIDATLFFESSPIQALGLPINPHGIFELSLFCENGLVRIIHSGKTIVRQRCRHPSESQLLDEEIERTGLDQVLGKVLEQIVQAIRTGQPATVEGKAALRTLEICSELNRQASLL
jgi:predicted dehydrogenase